MDLLLRLFDTPIPSQKPIGKMTVGLQQKRFLVKVKFIENETDRSYDHTFF